MHQIKTGKLINLAEQQLVDCNTKWINGRLNTGCKGGHQTIAFDYIKQTGIAGERQYPYKGWNSSGCDINHASQAQVKISGYTELPPNNESEMLKAASKQPLAVTVDTSCDAFRFYSSGILSQDCGTKLNHSVTIVGYGVANGEKYWLVKNSWGSYWGENGYIRIKRDSGIPTGICGIAMEPSYPF